MVLQSDLKIQRDAWVPQSAAPPTLGFGSGHGLSRFMASGPESGSARTAQSLLRILCLPLSLSLSLSLSLCPSSTHTLPLKILKIKIMKIKKYRNFSKPWGLSWILTKQTEFDLSPEK